MVIETVKIGCKLPSYVLEVGTRGQPGYMFQTLIGRNKTQGLDYGTTIVRSDLWSKWIRKNNTLRYFVDNQIFLIE